MVSPQFISLIILTWTVCAKPAEASWKRHRNHHESAFRTHVHHRKRQDSGTINNNATLPANDTLIAPSGYNNLTASASFNRFLSPVPLPNAQGPSLVSQGMVVTVTVPLYEVCTDLPGANSQSCSTIHDTVTTSSCSTVLTAGFDTYTISDCNQNITFSTQSTTSMVTVMASPTGTPVLDDQQAGCPSSPQTTYVQNIVSYHVTPWQSLANNDPSNITVVIVKTDFDGQVSSESIQEVWVVHTEYVPVTMTRTVSVTQVFQYPAVLYFGSGQSMSVNSGLVPFHTEVLYSTMSAQVMTSTSRLAAVPITSSSQTPETAITLTSKLTSTSTITVAGSTVTVFRTAEDLSSVEPTTTITLTENSTSTVTVYLATP